MPFEAESFDDVMYLDVIEHVDGDRKSLEEAFRVLKPGGRLIISTPNAGAPLTDTFFCEYMHDHGHMANERAGYTESELSAMLKDVGFTVSPARYTNVFLTELLITATKLGYRLLKPNYASQADVVEVSNSPLFALHKKVFFPFGYVIGRAEEKLLSRALKGHCMIILARKPA
jgi:SAM-dependent methyltransferase